MRACMHLCMLSCVYCRVLVYVSPLVSACMYACTCMCVRASMFELLPDTTRFRDSCVDSPAGRECAVIAYTSCVWLLERKKVSIFPSKRLDSKATALKESPQ
jgi:hypothetical protein